MFSMDCARFVALVLPSAQEPLLDLSHGLMIALGLRPQMPVEVECDFDTRMPHDLLHALRLHTLLNKERGRHMTKIVKAVFRELDIAFGCGQAERSQQREP